MEILDKTKPIANRYKELEVLLVSPEIIAHNSYYLKLAEEKNKIEKVAKLHFDIEKNIADIDKLNHDLETEKDSDIKEIITDEIVNLRAELVKNSKLAEQMLLNTASGKVSYIVLEIRPMNEPYGDFVQNIIDAILLVINGKFKVAKKGNTIQISGNNAYEIFDKMTGVVKIIGQNGGIGFVYMLAYTKFDETKVDDKDLRIDVFHSSGAGGQNVNKVATAIRVTHLPTGLVVTCQDERSQIKNKQRALATIKERLKSLDAEAETNYKEEKIKALNTKKNSGKISLIVDLNKQLITDNELNKSVRYESECENALKTIFTERLLKIQKEILTDNKIW